MVEYIQGDIIQAIADVNLAEGRTVEEFEWKWDNIIKANTSMIQLSTTGTSTGEHVLSLRVLNDCGSWSEEDKEYITMLEATGILNFSTNYVIGDTITINWSNVNFLTGGILLLQNPADEEIHSWNITTDAGSKSYTLAFDDLLGTWWVYLLNNEHLVVSMSFDVSEVCPIPTVNIVFI